MGTRRCRADLPHVQAVDVLEARPGIIGFEVGRTDGNGCWVVLGAIEVVGADEGELLAGIEGGIVLRIATYSDDRVASLECSKVLKEVVGKVVGMAVISGKVWEGGEFDAEGDEGLSYCCTCIAWRRCGKLDCVESVCYL